VCQERQAYKERHADGTADEAIDGAPLPALRLRRHGDLPSTVTAAFNDKWQKFFLGLHCWRN
jgi:hypothetical protein